ncbi:MAG: Replicative DNA helicase [bacterium ADurb.Bin429]|nr:MAG: Replicative DNA helicase [bacterium ADurb.Bin429]
MTSGNPVLDKIPPQSLEAEQAALGAMMLEQEAISRAVELLREEDFYREAHRTIFRGILELFGRNEPVDLITLGEWLRARNELETVGGTLYLTTIMSQVPTAAGIGHYATIIRARSLQRQLIRAADEIMTSAYQSDKDVDELVDASEQKIFAIAERSVTSGFVRLQDLVRQQFFQIEDSRESGTLAAGVGTGFGELDGITAGLHPTDLIILAARPSMGKTAMALNIARNVALDEKLPVAIFSIEMAKEQLALRLLCSEARVSQDTVRHSMVSDDDLTRLGRAVERIWDCPIFIDDTPSITVLEMRGKARRLKAQHGLGLIVVDYLQLMHSNGTAENRVQEIAQIARGLKALARELKVPVVALSQLSRMVESRQPRIPQLSDLRESGAIEQDADLVMFLYRPGYYGDEEIIRACVDNPSERKDLENDAARREATLETMRNTTFLIVAKQRNGPTGNVRLRWVKEHGIFEDIEHQ